MINVISCLWKNRGIDYLLDILSRKNFLDQVESDWSLGDSRRRLLSEREKVFSFVADLSRLFQRFDRLMGVVKNFKNGWQMKIVHLGELYSVEDTKSKNKQKRLMEIACLDPAVRLCLRITNPDGLWESSVDSILDMNHRSLFPADDYKENEPPVLEVEGVKVCLNERESGESQYFLVLHEASVERLRKFDSALTSFFESLLIMTPDQKIKEILPSVDAASERVFVLCAPEKINDSKLGIDDYSESPIHGSLIYAYVDAMRVELEYRDELKNILPDAFKIPEFIQERMLGIPRKYEKRPERLESLIFAYRNYWAKKNPETLSGQQIKTTNNKVRDYLGGSFGELQSEFGDERKVGGKLLAFAVRAIEPDCIKSGKNRITRNDYRGVPVRLWILLCVAEYFWKRVEEGDITNHPEGVHIEKVLSLFGCDGYFKKAIIPENTWFNTTPYEDARQDYQGIIFRYPELRFFSSVGFGSENGFAATILRPSWAKAKSGGGGSGSYGCKRSKGRENFVFVKVGKGECDD